MLRGLLAETNSDGGLRQQRLPRPAPPMQALPAGLPRVLPALLPPIPPAILL
jgi:hypothetical protein